MALLDDLVDFVSDNTANGSWQKPQLYQRTAKFIDDHDLGGGGGGGSSDFTIANVSITNTADNGMVNAEVPVVYEADPDHGAPAYSTGLVTVSPGNTSTCKVAIYKGNALMAYNSNDWDATATGSATVTGIGGIIITGDCAISMIKII